MSMKKRIFLCIIAIFLLVPLLIGTSSADSAVVKQGDTGSDVYAIQRRLNELGYLNYRPTGKFSDMTAQAVRQFQQINDIAPDGQVGRSTMQAIFSDTAKRNVINPEFKRIVGIPYSGEVTEKGALSAWETVDAIFRVGTKAQITDYNSGQTFGVTRVGGARCAQVVPETEEDYTVYSEVFRGETWEHRPVLVTINGVSYAASLFGQPTGTRAHNASGMLGYTILYFNNSRTDIFELADEEHILALTGIAADAS